MYTAQIATSKIGSQSEIKYPIYLFKVHSPLAIEDFTFYLYLLSEAIVGGQQNDSVRFPNTLKKEISHWKKMKNKNIKFPCRTYRCIHGIQLT